MLVKDRAGVTLAVGDVVRIVSVPDLTSMRAPTRKESEEIFNWLLGRYKQLKAFDQFGRVELAFRYKGSLHFVWIEPEHLRKKRPKPERR